MSRIVLGFCLCLLSGVAWSTVSRLPSIAWPQGTEVYSMPTSLWVNRVPLEAGLARLPMRLDAALDNLLEQLGNDILIRPHQSGWMLSPRLSPDWVLTLVPDGEDTSVVTLSAVLDSRPVIRQAHSRNWLIPGGNRLLEVTQDDGPASVEFSVDAYPGLSSKQLSRRFAERLAQQGWAGADQSLVHDRVRAGERLYAVVVDQAAGSALVAWHIGQASQPRGGPLP